MITKRQFLATSAASGVAMVLGGLPAFAQGGDDPINGIDIIIKKDPGSQPIRPLSLNGREIENLNHLKGDARPAYLAKILTSRFEKIGKNIHPPMPWEKILREGILAHWCGPCKMVNSFTIVAAIAEPKTRFTITFKIHFGK